MKQKKYILFDLDGTLTDSGLGITKSVQYSLQSFGIEEQDLTKLQVFVGPPLKESFMEFYKMPEQQAIEAVKKYREYYKEKGIFENSVYDGIEELLKELKKAGKELLVATSKPEVFAVQILQYFHIEQYFSHIAGAKLDGSLEEKIDVMKYALELGNIEHMDEVVMIGDRKFDIEASKELGIDSIGVLFGFGSKEELVSHGATHLAKSPKEIAQILL